MRRFLIAFLLIAFSAGSADAQRRRTVQTGEPGTWLSLSLAGFTGDGVNDGRSASSWDFGNSTNFQYGASLERPIGGGSSFGIAGSYSRVPFVYSSNTGIPLPGNISGARCVSCDAHLDMMSLVGTFHLGSGVGFHQVITFSGGIVAYQNLKRDADNVKLAPGGGNIDPLFSFGYGIGYGLSERTALEFVPDYSIAIHERSGLSNGESNTNGMRSFKLALRMGFGGRTVRR